MQRDEATEGDMKMAPGWFKRNRRRYGSPVFYGHWIKTFREPGSVLEKTIKSDSPEMKYVQYVAERRGRRSKLLWSSLGLIAVSGLALYLTSAMLVQIIYFAALAMWAVASVLVQRRSATYNIIVGYMTLICLIDENPRLWGYPTLMRALNSELKRLADCLARRPSTLHTDHPKVLLTATRKAAYVRNLQVWVSRPSLDVRDRLLKDLQSGLSTFTGRHWDALKEPAGKAETAATEAQVGWLMRLSYVLFGIALAAGAIAILTNGQLWGVPATLSQFGATALGVGAYLAFAAAGAIPGEFQHGLDAALKFTKSS